MTSDGMSLRERRRAAVRADIDEAAMRLFAAHGYDAITTDDIASAAGVSPSTYYRHVRSKEDLLLDPVTASGAEIVEEFGRRPSDELTHVALAQAISTRSSAVDNQQMALWRSAMVTAPDIMSRVALISEGDRDALVSMAAARMNLDETMDFRPGLVVEVLLRTAEYAYHRWLTARAEDARPLSALIDEMLTVTCAGTWEP